MKQIVACPQCQRQYDASGHQAGEKFHCFCGEQITIPELKSYSAAVISCSTCGGKRKQGESSCQYCGSEFTIHEQDLHTICPHCLTRISDQAKFCHHCGTAISIQGKLGDSSGKNCPSCRSETELSVRKIKTTQFSALECNICAGLWVETAIFEFLEKKMIELASSGVTKEYVSNTHTIKRQSLDDQNLYRKCPICENIMHRRNYGPGSGIIMDHCQKHGFWFDNQELGAILRWIRTGGLLASRKRREQIKKDNDRIEKLLALYDEKQRMFKGGDISDYYF